MTEISHIHAQNAMEENRSSQTEKYGKPGTRRIHSGDKCLPVILYIRILVCKLAAWCQCMYVRMYVCMYGYICVCVYCHQGPWDPPVIHGQVLLLWPYRRQEPAWSVHLLISSPLATLSNSATGCLGKFTWNKFTVIWCFSHLPKNLLRSVGSQTWRFDSRIRA